MLKELPQTLSMLMIGNTKLLYLVLCWSKGRILTFNQSASKVAKRKITNGDVRAEDGEYLVDNFKEFGNLSLFCVVF